MHYFSVPLRTWARVRHVLSFLTCLLGVFVWGIGNVFYLLSMLMAELMAKISPEHTHGNCWSYALPRIRKHGGYALVRPADGNNRFMWFFPVWHVLWVKHLPRTAEVEQFIPLERKTGKWFSVHTWWYRGMVRFKESPHNVKEA